MPADTLGLVRTAVLNRFPRGQNDNNLVTELTTFLPEWVRDLCSKYAFWFLRYDPGDFIPGQFATINGSATVLQGLTHYQTSWVDRGWLHAVQGQDLYFIAAPSIQGQNDLVAGEWQRVRASRVNFVKEFNLRGDFVQDFNVWAPSFGFSRVSWTSQGQPTHCFLERGRDSNGVNASWLRLFPIPDKDYLYAVSFDAAEPIPSGAADATTNRLFQEYPEAIITAGMIYAAEYFNETEIVQYYTKKLWGEPPRGGYGKFQAHVGLIGRMVKDTIRMAEQDDWSLSQYKGARAAIGRTGTGTGRTRFRGTYIGRWGFS